MSLWALVVLVSTRAYDQRTSTHVYISNLCKIDPIEYDTYI